MVGNLSAVSVNGNTTAMPQVNKVWGIFNAGGLTAIVFDVGGSAFFVFILKSY
jgi:hypothetical protein